MPRLGGVVQGGGLDPMLYVFATTPLHKDIIHRSVGIPIEGDTEKHIVGTLGLIDDTGVLGLDLAQTQATLHCARAVISAGGQFKAAMCRSSGDCTLRGMKDTSERPNPKSPEGQATYQRPKPLHRRL